MKYVIIGGVAGGASTAARLRRMDEKAEIVIFEKGKYISYANCGLPYYIGDVIKDRNKLFVQTASSFSKRFNIDVRVSTEVTRINVPFKTVTARNCQTGEVYEEDFDKLVLAPGAEPVRPPLPGIELEGIFTLRNVTDTDYIKEYITEHKTQRAVVIGAGFIGLEMAENLHHLGVDIHIVEMGPQILAPLDAPVAALVQQHIRAKGVNLHLNSVVTGFGKGETGALNVLLKDGEAIECDLVILSIGVRPDTRLAAPAGLQLGTTGGILVDEYLHTSEPDIYAVGDAIEFTNPITGKPAITYLAGPANKQGRICANNMVLGDIQKYEGSINTAIVKVFDLTVGAAGVPAKHLEKDGIKHIVSTTHSGSHAGYYPGAQQMSIQITFSPDTGQLLGAQVAGYEGVDKRLDVMSSVIKNKGTIFDLCNFEHAYAPPFSSAKDPVNIAGFVAENILQGRLKVIQGKDLRNVEEEYFLLDVRTRAEYESGCIPNAVNIPVDELRDRLKEIPAEKKVILYCQIGLRGYLAQRILVQHDFTNVLNLSGGYYLWKICDDEIHCEHTAVC